MDWYLKVIKNYAGFDGRARRQEFWMFVLFNFIIAMVLGFVDRGVGLTFGVMETGVLGSIYSLAVFIPGLAVGVRRLHDIGKSGWMLLVMFIPIVGFIWLIVLFATEGNAGDNEYGSDPKQIDVVN